MVRKTPVTRRSSRNQPKKGEFGAPTFDSLMTAATKAISIAAKSNRRVKNPQAAINRRLEEYLRAVGDKRITLPPKTIATVKKHLAIVFAGPEQKATATQRPGLHPTVALLLHENYEHLRTTVGVDAARKAVASVARPMMRASRGRPSTIPMATLVRAKRLSDAGKNYGEI
jgi:hypothetical protein